MVVPGDPLAVMPSGQMPALQQSMLDATPDCIKLLSLDGRLLMMNRAGCVALGVAQQGPFGMAWLPLLSESVREAGQAALDQAAGGTSAKFVGTSPAEHGVNYWDNLLTPMRDETGQVVSILCVSRDITEKTVLASQLAEAVASEKLIAGEMRHRIKNMFLLVSGLISLAEREARAGGRGDALAGLVRDKLGSLARASDAVFAAGNGGAQAEPVALYTLAASVLEPYGLRCALSGSTPTVRRESLTTYALLFHELATNAVKYGALSNDTGHVSVDLWQDRQAIGVIWTETAGPPIQHEPQRQGFGTGMVDRVVRAGRGTVEREWREEGLIVRLSFPSA